MIINTIFSYLDLKVKKITLFEDVTLSFRKDELKFSLISSAIYNFTKVFDNLIDTVDGFIYSLNISVFLPQLIAYHKTKLTNISLRV